MPQAAESEAALIRNRAKCYFEQNKDCTFKSGDLMKNLMYYSSLEAFLWQSATQS